MSVATPHTQLLLKVSLSATQSSPSLARALDAIPGVRRQDGWIDLDEEGIDGALRHLDRVCRDVQAGAIVLAEAATPAAPDAPYARLWDRTEALATQLDAWREGRMRFPHLAPGELVRLPA